MSGSGSKSFVTRHRLRGSSAIFLFEAGHYDFFVVICTGNRDLRSLKSYQHLGGDVVRKKQQLHIE